MAGIGDLLGTALEKTVGAFAGPALSLAGGIAGNVISGFNQRAARKWEEDMYNQYNSPSALVRQYNDAGINPALMFGQATPAAPTDTAAAPVSEFQTGTVTEMLAQLMNLDLLESERNLKDSQTNKNNAEAIGQATENTIRQKFGLLLAKADLDKVLADIDKLKADKDLTEYQRKVLGPLEEALKKATARGLNADAAIDEWRSAYMHKYNANPDADPIKQALTSLLEVLEDLNEEGTGPRIDPTTPPGYGGR